MPFLNLQSLKKQAEILLEDGFNTTDTSYIVYFFALAKVLKDTGSSAVFLDSENGSNRDSFIDEVTNIIGIDDNNVFHPMSRLEKGHGWYKGKNTAAFVKSNLLTTQYARGNENYPSKNPLLSFNQKKEGRNLAILHKNWQTSLNILLDRYSLTVKLALFTFLLRKFNFQNPTLNFDDLKNGISVSYGIDISIFFSQHESHDGIDLISDSQTPIELKNILPEAQKLNIPDKKKPFNLLSFEDSIPLPKPFILLAGISGTGKSRFIREQAKHSGGAFLSVAVRPDWHEPSDLLGYISRLSGKAEYVITDVLRFMLEAWAEIAKLDIPLPCKTGDNSIRIQTPPELLLRPFWLCLDEMNLAPVEQYFADYLSVSESRYLSNGLYECQPLLSPTIFSLLDWQDNGEEKGTLEGIPFPAEWRDAFCRYGMPLPPQLLVAGTVNMDETTHGFSRKVIDRAMTLDFGVFFPNDFKTFLMQDQQKQPLLLSCPTRSHISSPQDFALVAADTDGHLTLGFAEALQSMLKNSPFEPAFRALNELMLSVVCFAPKTEAELQAVWDDFLMMKILPRIEGDEDKLYLNMADDNKDSVLSALTSLLETQLSAIWDGYSRPDLLQKNADGSVAVTTCRSKAKINQMEQRLKAQGFTHFWP